MALAYTEHAQLPPVKQALSEQDILVVDVKDASIASGYLTSNSTLRTASEGIQTIINETTSDPLITVLENGGLLGNGTPENQLRLDMELVADKWAAAVYSNIVQIGKPNTMLPISSGTGTEISFTVTEDIDYHISGLSGTIPKGTVWTTVESYATAHLYVVLYNGTVVGNISADLLPETYTRVYIGTRNGYVDVANTFPSICRVNESRISDSPVGSGVASTTGLPSEPHHTSWGYQNPSYSAVGFIPEWGWGIVSHNQWTEEWETNNHAYLHITDPINVSKFYRDYYITAVISATPDTINTIYINGSKVIEVVGSLYTPVNISKYLRSGGNMVDASGDGIVIQFSGIFYEGAL